VSVGPEKVEFMLPRDEQVFVRFWTREQLYSAKISSG
jgi:hypothetical protein